MLQRVGRRRRRTVLALALSACSVACGSNTIGFGVDVDAGSPASDGHLLSRPPKTAPALPAATGAQPLGLDNGRDGVIYVPPGLTGPAPLFVLLHGATGSAEGITRRIDAFALADELKMVILAPDSRDRTWDAIRGQFGPDVAFIDKALASVFAHVPIDKKRVAIGGFSDGASYAISLGLQNGDLFTHVAAFSPGFVIPGATHGKPRFFVSHGTADKILPIDRCSRVIVSRLQKRGYDVTFREFDGGHDIPPAIAREGMTWIAASGS